MEPLSTRVQAPSLGAMFLTFGKIGLLSFGGGSTTLVLMEQEIVHRRAWLSNHDFLFTMALSRMWPGVHLLAQSVLIGHVLRGLIGSIVCLLGMMVPSTTVVILCTAFFIVLRENPLGVGMIGGLLPATAGMAFAVAYRFGRAEVEGTRPRVGALMIGLAVGSFVLMAFAHVSSVLAVLAGGFVGVLLIRRLEGADGPP